MLLTLPLLFFPMHLDLVRVRVLMARMEKKSRTSTHQRGVLTYAPSSITTLARITNSLGLFHKSTLPLCSGRLRDTTPQRSETPIYGYTCYRASFRGVTHLLRDLLHRHRRSQSRSTDNICPYLFIPFPSWRWTFLFLGVLIIVPCLPLSLLLGCLIITLHVSGPSALLTRLPIPYR